MKTLVSSIEAEYRRYKALAEAALAQLSETELATPAPGNGNSVAVIAWHMGGNLLSRFTEFLTSDGEKPWRHREQEFAPRTPTRMELEEHWERGWRVLFETLAQLKDDQMHQGVRIRGTDLEVQEALLRSLGHACYHVGQIVYQAKALRGDQWRYLSIPPGQSEAYNRNPGSDTAEAHAARLQKK